MKILCAETRIFHAYFLNHPTVWLAQNARSGGGDGDAARATIELVDGATNGVPTTCWSAEQWYRCGCFVVLLARVERYISAYLFNSFFLFLPASMYLSVDLALAHSLYQFISIFSFTLSLSLF